MRLCITEYGSVFGWLAYCLHGWVTISTMDSLIILLMDIICITEQERLNVYSYGYYIWF